MNTRFKTKPYNHQLEGLNKASGKKGYAYFCEMGTGKSWIGINEAAILWGQGSIDSLLILAPKSVHVNWDSIEIPKHMPDWVNYKIVSWSASDSLKNKKYLNSIFDVTENRTLRILTINWDAIRSTKGFTFVKKFCSITGKLLILCDESHRVKNPKSVTYKNLSKLKPYSAYRRIMTGSPVLNSPFDLFTQMSFLDEHILETDNYFCFKAEYAEMLQPGNKLYEHIAARVRRGKPQVVAKDKNGLPKYKNLERLSRLIAPYSYRVLKKDCLDLPDKIYTMSWFELGKNQRIIYDKMKNEARMIIGDGNETPVNKLNALMKLSQITSGFMFTPDHSVIRTAENPRIELLKERLEDYDGQIIIWSRFHVEMDDIKKACRTMGIQCSQFDGRITSKEKRQIEINKFINGDTRLFLGQTASGIGITLNNSSYVIYYNNSFSLGDRIQSEDRNHRIGQKNNVTYEDLIAEKTVDIKILNALKGKKKISDLIVSNPMEFF